MNPTRWVMGFEGVIFVLPGSRFAGCRQDMDSRGFPLVIGSAIHGGSIDVG